MYTALLSSHIQEPNVSYIAFPKKGVTPEQDEWRKRLIIAVARADSNFNPDKQHICSIHFDRMCLLFHGKQIIFTSSTLHMTFNRLILSFD